MRATHTKTLFAFLFVIGLFIQSNMAQSVSTTKSGIPLPNQGSIASLHLDISKLDVHQIGGLKDAFIEFHEKVTSVEIGKDMMEMKVQYNQYMLVEDIQFLLVKYGAKIRRELYPVSDESLPIKN